MLPRAFCDAFVRRDHARQAGGGFCTSEPASRSGRGEWRLVGGGLPRSTALAAYKAVNAAGARLVRPGGLLFASSCSHHVEPERFAEAVHMGARQAGRRLARVRVGGQAADHPVLPGVRETEYLKHLVFAVR